MMVLLFVCSIGTVPAHVWLRTDGWADGRRHRRLCRSSTRPIASVRECTAVGISCRIAVPPGVLYARSACFGLVYRDTTVVLDALSNI